MNINWDAVKAGLEDGLSLVAKIAPLAAAAGPVGVTAGEIIGKVASFAAQALETAQNENTVLNSNDLATIEAAQKTLQAANDVLAQQIAQG